MEDTIKASVNFGIQVEGFEIGEACEGKLTPSQAGFVGTMNDVSTSRRKSF